MVQRARTIGSPIAIGCQVYMALQTIVSREIQPGPGRADDQVSQSGFAGNIVPSDCVLKGALRASEGRRRGSCRSNPSHLRGRGPRHEGRAAVEFHYGRATVNAPEMTAKLPCGRRSGEPKVGRSTSRRWEGRTWRSSWRRRRECSLHPSTFGGGRDYPPPPEVRRQ